MISYKQIYFTAFDTDIEAGRMSYTFAGETRMILDHTEVDDAYRGQNIGKKILMEVVKYARENKIKITPLCPFAKSAFYKMEEIRDVLV